MPTRATRTGFAHLLSPGRIGPITLPNRVILPAMDMNVCHDGVIVEKDIEHYAVRAAGGAGMIITSASAVAFPVGATSLKEPGLSDDRFIPGLKALADAVHDAGSLLCVQATHHGQVARMDTLADRPLLAPSEPVVQRDLSSLRDNTPDELAKMAAVSGGKTATYRIATDEDISWLIDQFAEAARRVMEAGADAIEIHCAHGYILGAFLSSADNRRTDGYGGPLANRARLACEVVAAVRRVVGDRLAVLVRVAGQEYGGEGALTLEETVQAARLFEAAGADAIHVTGWGRNPFKDFFKGPVPNEIAAYRDNARRVKAAVNIPVILVGRVLPEVGEEIIAAGDADFVAMGRQLLADPELVNKLRAGRRESVRPCINCYVCVEQNFWDDTPLCAVNPGLGDEDAVPRTFLPVPSPRHVVVVGGGPAGMETARVATERGHRVTLVEAGDRLGGSAWFSQLTTPANGPLLQWQRHELERLGVVVQLDTRATAESIMALRPSAVVLATGAHRGLPDVPGAELPHVQTGDTLRALLTGAGGASTSRTMRWAARAGRLVGVTRRPELLRRATRAFLPVGKDVVVIGGSLVGLELAEFFAERGKRVTVVEAGAQLGLPMALPRRWHSVARATAHEVRLERQATVQEITPSTVRFRDHEGTEQVVAADLVVVASEVSSGAPLARELADRGVQVEVVGDAAEVDYIQGAIHTAWETAGRL